MTSTDRQRQYEQLLQAHRGIIYKVAWSYSRTPADRDDLVQEICLQIWRSFSSYDSARTFSTWMYRVALNVAISHARRVERDVAGHFEPLTEFHLETVAAEEASPQAEQLDVLHGLIGQLEPLNRALMMLYLDQRSHAEIAEIVGLTQTNVATRINRIKQKLSSQMSAAMTGA